MFDQRKEAHLSLDVLDESNWAAVIVAAVAFFFLGAILVRPAGVWPGMGSGVGTQSP
jgi:hypothetical protein